MNTSIESPGVPCFPLGTDSVLLAAFTARTKHKRICDLGAGPGTIGLLLQSALPEIDYTGIELDRDTAEAANRLIAQRGRADSMRVICGDIRNAASLCKSGEFDAVVTNPPYFPVGSGRPPAGEKMISARTEATCTLEQLTEAASYILKYGGTFFLVHKPERLSEILVTLHNRGLEPKILQFVKNRSELSPNLVLIAAKKGGKPNISILPDFLLTDRNGDPTEEFKKIQLLGES